MFGIFKRKEDTIHEPLSKQRDDAINSVGEMFRNVLVPQILNGLDCDQIPNGVGEFGSLDNPIPVNGSIGEIKYLVKLRGKTAQSVMFHRLGSKTSKVVGRSVDCYEVVCLDGTQWGYLHFDFYHPRRSNLAPSGYILMPYIQKLGSDIPFGFGCNGVVDNFPYGLPLVLRKLYKGEVGESLAAALEDRLNKYNFQRHSAS